MKTNNHKKSEVTVAVEEYVQEYQHHLSGGCVRRHSLVDTECDDFNDNREIAVDKAQSGCGVDMLPILQNDHPLRAIIYAEAYERKCPDLKIDGVFHEVKVVVPPVTENRISDFIRRAQEQSAHVIIKLNEVIAVRKLRLIAKGRFKTHQDLLSIEYKMDGVYHRFTREQLT